MLTSDQIAGRFSTAAAVLDILGDNGFRAAAFAKVARSVEELGESVVDLAAGGRLEEIGGAGASSRKILQDLVSAGTSTDLDDLIASVPSGLLDLLTLNGVGPKTVGLLWRERQIVDLPTLAAALAADRLVGLKGFGPKKIAAVAEALRQCEASAGRIGLGEALALADAVVQASAGHADAPPMIVGDVRRGVDLLDRVELLTVTDVPDTQPRVVVGRAVPVQVHVATPGDAGVRTIELTGDADHVASLRRLGELRGGTEREVYENLGLPYIPPELRVGTDDRATLTEKGRTKLVEIAHLRGDLHTHTVASDGRATIEQMATAAKALGYEYLGITDHSKSQPIANGLSPQRLLKHAADVRRVNEQIDGITIFAGTECDILADGSLDYDDAVLAELDFVVASPHVALSQDARTATDRLLRAIDHPRVNILGHPTGRLIARRRGLPIEIETVASRAAASGVALEINASYPRLDLRDEHARIALAAECTLVIDTDAHSTDGLNGMALGVTVARRAAATPASVLNTRPLADVRAWFGKC